MGAWNSEGANAVSGASSKRIRTWSSGAGPGVWLAHDALAGRVTASSRTKARSKQSQGK